MTAIQTVEQATQLAVDLVRKYYSFVYPIAAREEKIFAETGSLEDFKVTLGPLL